MINSSQRKCWKIFSRFFSLSFCCSFVFVPVSICWTIVFVCNDDMRMCIAFKWLNKVEHFHKLYNSLISRINCWRIYLTESVWLGDGVRLDECWIKEMLLIPILLIPTLSMIPMIVSNAYVFDCCCFPKELFQRQFTRESNYICRHPLAQ